MPDIMKMGSKNPNYLGSFDLYDICPQEITVTINNICDETILSSRGDELAAVMYFDESYKPMILNPTNKKRLSKLFKTKNTEKMTGKKITIVVEKIKAFGKISDALRIKETLPMQAQSQPVPPCENCGQKLKPFGKMNEEQLAVYTKKQYGQVLCSDCAITKSKEKKEAEQERDFDEIDE